MLKLILVATLIQLSLGQIMLEMDDDFEEDVSSKAQPYEILTQICCDGVVHEIPEYLTGQVTNFDNYNMKYEHPHCCGSDLYNSEIEICCPDGITRPLPQDRSPDAIYECCEGKVKEVPAYRSAKEEQTIKCCKGANTFYNVSESFCSGNTILPRTTENEEHEICSNELMDPKTHLCCAQNFRKMKRNSHGIKIYVFVAVAQTCIRNSEDYLGPNFSIVPRSSDSNYEQCCGNGTYNSLEEICCYGKVYKNAENTQCCGDLQMNTCKNSCVNNEIVPMIDAKDILCGDQVIHHKSRSVKCDRGQVVSIHDQGRKSKNASSALAKPNNKMTYPNTGIMKKIKLTQSCGDDEIDMNERCCCNDLTTSVEKKTPLTLCCMKNPYKL